MVSSASVSNYFGSTGSMDTHIVCDSHQIELIGAHIEFYHDVVLCAFVHCSRIGDLNEVK